MQGKLLRQYREKLRAGTMSDPPNLEVLRGFKLLDRSALENWLWAVEDRELCAICGVVDGEPPALPETLLLPHRVAPVIERIQMELDEGPPSWAHQAPLHYALALAMEDPGELRRVLAEVEVRSRAGVGDLLDLLMSPTARSRRVSGPIARAICARMPAGRGLRNAARLFLTRPLGLRAGMAIPQALGPVLAAEVVEQIRRPGRTPDDLVQRLTEWLCKDGHTLRRALMQLFRAARHDAQTGGSAFGALVQHVGEDDGQDDLIAVSVLIRAFIEAVSGPLYRERRWPPGPAFDVCPPHAGGDDEVALIWTGATGEAVITLTADLAWQCKFSKTGRASGPAPVRSLGLPEILVAGLEQAGVGTVASLERLADAELYALPGVGRTGVNAIRDALRSEVCGLPTEATATLEGLRRFACVHLDEERVERPLAEIEELSRAIARDLDQAGFATLGEVLRWSTPEMATGAVLSPGRQRRLLVSLLAHIEAQVSAD